MSSGFFTLQRKVRGEECQASGRGSNKIRKEAWGESKEQREDKETGREARCMTGAFFSGTEGEWLSEHKPRKLL